MALQTNTGDLCEPPPFDSVTEDHMRVSSPITTQLDASTKPSTDLENSSVYSIAWTTPLVYGDGTEEEFDVKDVPSRPASAPPSFPDCRGLHLLPHQKMCAFAYCDLERQKPSLYCDQHVCRANNCGGAIALRAPENNWETNFIPGPFICLDEYSFSSWRREDVRDDALQIRDKSSSNASTEARYCSVHVCSIPLCDRRRASSGLYCIVHRCEQKDCSSHKIHPIASFCTLHTPPHSRPRTSHAHRVTGYITSGIQVDGSDTSSHVSREKKMQ